MSQVVVTWMVGGLNIELQMEQENEWNPVAKFGPSMHLNHSKLIENTIGELSVEFQLTKHHSNKAMALIMHSWL